MIVGLVVHHLFAIPNSGYHPRQSLDLDLLSVANVLNGLLHWSTMAAVPLLSILSGFLYFARPEVKHRPLLTKRVRSVLLPSLMWTSLWFVVGYLAATVGKPYGMFSWLSYDADQFTWLTPLNGIIGVTKIPLAFQFWFIHDLALTLALAPAIGWILNRAGAYFILALTAVWLLNAVPFPFFSGNVLFFFSTGSFFAVRSLSLTDLAQATRRWQRAIAGVFLFLLLTRLASDLHPIFGSHAWLCVLRLAGVATVSMFVVAQLHKSRSWLHSLSRFSPYAFFIFASHYPLIEFYKVIVERIPLQGSALGQVLTLLAVPAATVITCILSANFIARRYPRLFAFANGGRGLRIDQATAAEPAAEKTTEQPKQTPQPAGVPRAKEIKLPSSRTNQ